MSSIKPATPKGTRDFGPEQSAKRAYIIDAIKRHFKNYGFQQLETPAMENLSTLTGKYGDEGDQLLFKIVNSGDFLSKAPEDKRKSSNELLPYISEKGLRYDLTVPFARYVVSHQHEIAFPFKRFQIQPVWRADRPQKGRYREFWQCDADIIGTQAIWNEVELSLLIHDVFSDLKLRDFSLKVNHREILNAMAAYCGLKGKEIPFCVELDKIDKTSPEQVIEAMKAIGGNATKIEQMMAFIQKEQSVEEKITILKNEYQLEDQAMSSYFEMLSGFDRSFSIDFDLSLARGLTYYTGMVFEVKPTSVQMGSICGGGRYDNLTGVFGMPDVSGVGISFGLDRIYDVMEELALFPAELSQSVDVLIVHFDEACFNAGLKMVAQFRSQGISTDIYPESVKIKKQFNYADKINARHTLVIGSEELTSGRFKLKDMKSGDQRELSTDQLIEALVSK
jgi:histidyl-tRNA synthetase